MASRSTLALTWLRCRAQDAIIFTAGIGENNAHLRQRVIEGFGYMGIKLDEAKNEACTAPNVKETIISTPDSTVKVIVIPTNEEIMIAPGYP